MVEPVSEGSPARPGPDLCVGRTHLLDCVDVGIPGAVEFLKLTMQKCASKNSGGLWIFIVGELSQQEEVILLQPSGCEAYPLLGLVGELDALVIP